jgi:hypothetical protein
VAGALRVYLRGLEQVVVPWTLSGDYSAPQEPIPARLVFPESVLGALAMLGPLLACPVLVARAWWRERRGTAPDAFLEGIDRGLLVALSMAWIVVSYFPVSNMPVVLPTVRAERFWYFPSLGTAILLALVFSRLIEGARSKGALRAAVVAFVLFLGFQCYAARRHALDYATDLAFWDATRKAVPRSAKAHLNYSVMVGARGNLEKRLASNEVALELAPEWAMASVYLGDTLCRLHRPKEAVPHYVQGFSLGPSDMSLIALGLQCLWDEHELEEDSPVRGELQDVADKYPGSWLKYLVDDTFANGEEYKGVNPKYRPRGYNEGPKKDE